LRDQGLVTVAVEWKFVTAILVKDGENNPAGIDGREVTIILSCPSGLTSGDPAANISKETV